MAMVTASQPGTNAPARRDVRTYYDHCRNDYRILWRTDETGSIHYGYFDLPAATESRPPMEWARLTGAFVASLAATSAAALLAVVPTTWSRERAVRCLRFAVRGRSARHARGQVRMTDVCAGAVDLRPGDVVLDAGCGVGGTAVHLASRYSVTVHGINVHAGHISEARRRARAAQPGARVTVSAQDFTEMGIASGAVDVVWALESVCHALDKQAFLTEANRVLRPGGRVMVADFFLRDGQSEAAAGRVRGWTAGWALPNLARVGEFRARLAASGFHDVVYHDIAAHVMPSAERLHKASRIVLPVHALLERIGARTTVQAHNVRAAREQYTTLREGIWTYGIFVATK